MNLFTAIINNRFVSMYIDEKDGDVRSRLVHGAAALRTAEAALQCNPHALTGELELELIQPHMTQKPVLRGEVGCACVAREVSAERGGMSRLDVAK